MFDVSFKKFRIIGAENLPHAGGCIIASNHESYFDPPAIGYCIYKATRRKIYFLARADLGRNWLARRLFAGMRVLYVAKGKSDIGLLRRVVKLVQNGEWALIFPEGSSRPEHKKLHAGVGLIALQSQRPVVPVFIDVDGYKRQITFRGWMSMILRWLIGRGSLEIRFGQPIESEELGGSYEAAAQKAYDAIYRLKA